MYSGGHMNPLVQGSQTNALGDRSGAGNNSRNIGQRNLYRKYLIDFNSF
jgi:hypothetical protein